MSKGNIPNKAAKVLGTGKVPPKAAKVLGTGNAPLKAQKVLGIGDTGQKPANIAKSGGALTNAVSKGKVPTTPGFKPADPKTTGKMKPGAPIIGANRGPGANSASINADRMKNTIKKLGM